MPYDAFISHSNAAKLTAYAICNELESDGIRCWILPRDLSGGTGWDQSISRAIQSCRVIIVVLTDFANRSDRVERQIELAFASGAIVIPFCADSSPAQSESPPEPDDSLHWLDAVTPEVTERIKNLSEQVEAIVKADKTSRLEIAAGNVSAEAKNEQDPMFPDQDRGIPVTGHLEAERMEAGSAERGPLVTRRPILPDEFADEEAVSILRKNTSNWLKIRGLALILVPFAIIFGVGFCQMQKPGGMLNLEPALTVRAIASPSIRSESGTPTTPLRVSGSPMEHYVVAVASSGSPKPSPTLSGEPPKSPWLIGVYGESAELSENAWDFIKLRVAVAPEPSH